MLKDWLYNVDGRYLGMVAVHEDASVSTSPECSVLRLKEPVAYRYRHEGFPGEIADGSDMDAQECVYPPIPGRDFLPWRDAVATVAEDTVV